MKAMGSAALVCCLAATPPLVSAQDEWRWFRPTAPEPAMTNPADPAQSEAYSHFAWAVALDRLVNASTACGERPYGWAHRLESDMELLQHYRLRRWAKTTTDPRRFTPYLESLSEWARGSRRALTPEDCKHVDDAALALADESSIRMRRELRNYLQNAPRQE